MVRLKLVLGPSYKRQIALFDQMRRKRNRLVYETVGLVSQQEVEQALAFARAFVEEIRLRVSGQPRLGFEEQAQSPEA